MDSTIKSQWIAALRSGDYKQGDRRLRQDDFYCCLGVLCDLHSKAHPGDCNTWRRTSDYAGPCYSYGDDMITTLPDNVRHWAKMDCSNPAVTFDGEVRTLAWLNDNGSTFEQIAQHIEEQL